jgi:hypothetical protein
MKEHSLNVDDVDVGEEVRRAPAAEPLLPVEKKLIAISLALGLGLLALVLVFAR